MLHQSFLFEKQENEFFTKTFSNLNLGKHLRSAGIKKNFGFSSLLVFQIIFQLVFLGRNWFRLLDSERGDAFPGKDVVYRFLNCPRHAWRKFLHSISFSIINDFEKLTSTSRTTVFIIDDSVLSRNRSKKAELLARIHDHTFGRFVKGYNMLTLGWSDGYSFIPIDFTMLSSAKSQNRYCGIKSDIDKRTHGYKRRKEALLKKTDALVQMIDNALKAGFSADYVLMDSWFTHSPVLNALKEKGMDVIGMVKPLKQKYLYQNQYLSLKELYSILPKRTKSEIISSVNVSTSDGLPVKLVFVKNRKNKREWLAILSTDLSLDDEEIVRIYGNRWSIETFFKFAKSYLKLGSEFQGRCFDMMISHTTIVFTRYLALEWEHRNTNDDRSFGGLFYLYCDEIIDINLKTALQQLMVLFIEIVKEQSGEMKSLIQCQLQELINGFPTHIRSLLLNLGCES